MSYTNLLFHVVFGTKSRSPMINQDIRPRLHQYMGGSVRSLGAIALEINGVADHVHLLIKMPPTLCVSKVLQALKSNTSVWAKENGLPKFGWQRRYGAFTVSASQAAAVRRYIRDQEIHHQKFDF